MSRIPGRESVALALAVPLVLAFVLAGLLAGCSVRIPDEIVPPQLLEQILDERQLRDRVVLAWALDDERRAWARERAPENLSEEERLQKLVEELLDNRVLPLEYDWETTGTAVEVFETRRANCLAFTNLFVGMAREVGVPVFFLAVENVATYRKEGDLVVVSDHIAVGFERAFDIKMFDFSEHGMQEHAKVHRISDLTALAMFHSNRGVEALRRGERDEARDWLRIAVTLDPGLATAWVNLGVVLRRSGDLEAAESAYRAAIELDPRLPSAYQNLASLLRFSQRGEEAREVEQMLTQNPTRNPYTYLVLGDVSRQRGRLDEAHRLYRRAANLSEEDGEPLAALGELALEMGNHRLARKMLRKALELDPEDPRARRLASRLEPEE